MEMEKARESTTVPDRTPETAAVMPDETPGTTPVPDGSCEDSESTGTRPQESVTPETVLEKFGALPEFNDDDDDDDGTDSVMQDLIDTAMTGAYRCPRMDAELNKLDKTIVKVRSHVCLERNNDL